MVNELLIAHRGGDIVNKQKQQFEQLSILPVIRLRCFCIADPGKLLWCSGSVHCLGAWSWSQGSSTPSGPASPMSGLQGRPGEQVTLEKISQGLHRVEVGRGRSVSAGPIASVSTGRRYKDTPIKILICKSETLSHTSVTSSVCFPLQEETGTCSPAQTDVTGFCSGVARIVQSHRLKRLELFISNTRNTSNEVMSSQTPSKKSRL